MNKTVRVLSCFFFFLFFSEIYAFSQQSDSTDQKKFFEKVSIKYSSISIKDFDDGFHHARYIYPGEKTPYELYDESQIAGFAENMVYLQNPDGGWAKNLDFQRRYLLSELLELQKKNEKILPVTYRLKTDKNGSTLDNRNIFSQIIYLAHVYKQIPDKRYFDCMMKAFQWILNAQHPVSGGFTGADVYAITFNDDVMADVLRFLRDVYRNDSLYSFFPDSMRKKAEEAYKKGIECIIKTQIQLTLKDGRKILTAWCQQHSHETFAPVWAREFEPPSVCTSESAKIVNLLMEDENPTEEIKNAVISACEWFDMDSVRIHGKKVRKLPAEGEVLKGRYYDYDLILVDDTSAPDLWARFYALDDSFDLITGARKAIKGTYPEVNTPVWCDYGCRYCQTFNELSKERRNGYGYTGRQPASTLSKYAKWKARFALK